MKGKSILVFGAVLAILMLSQLAFAEEITRKGVFRQMELGEEASLQFKGVECAAVVEGITQYSIQLNICGTRHNITPRKDFYFDIDNDKIQDIAANYEKVSLTEAVIKFRLTYAVLTNLNEKPTIESVETGQLTEDEETQKIIDESKDNKELIRRLSEKAGLKVDYSADVADGSATGSQAATENKSLLKTIQEIPYISYVIIGLLVLAVLIAAIHFSTNDDVSDKMADLFFEDKPGKKNGKAKQNSRSGKSKSRKKRR